MNQLIWRGPALDPSGYGQANRQYLRALDDLVIERGLGWVLRLRPKFFWHGYQGDIRPWWDLLKRMHDTPIDGDEPSVFIQHITPEQLEVNHQARSHHINITTFETDRMPKEWIMPMRAMDELWTFSQWGKEVFASCGFKKNVNVIPHGVETDLYQPGLDPIPEIRDALPEGSYVFGANFEWTERKNPGGLLRAYYRAFKKSDPVALVIKTFSRHKDFGKEIHNAIRRVQREEGGVDTLPPILVITDVIDHAEMPNFYASLDCYAHPSRGEGWGLPYTEAMATELPTIAVNWSGHTEYMTPENSYLVDDYKLVEVTTEQAGYQPQYVGHRWADVDADVWAAQMRYVFEHQDEAKAKGQQARQDMIAKWQWSHAAVKMVDRLTEVFEEI